VVNVVGSVGVLGSFSDQDTVEGVNFEFSWLKMLRTSKNFYSMMGIDSQLQTIEDKYKEVEEAISDLSQHHARTMDVTEFKAHQVAFQKQSPQLLDNSCSRKKLVINRQLRSIKQRYLSELVNTVYALDETLHTRKGIEREKAPVIVIGSATVNGIKNKRSVPSTAIINYLKRFFLVLTVDEYNTSQKCPKCWGQLKDGKGIRIKVCHNKDCQSTTDDGKTFPFHVNRDVSASMNLFAIALHLVSGLGRPDAFRRPQKAISKPS
jgi:hypothetical protein